jgi:hypothetical protein
MTNNTPPNINSHAICAALRHARNSLCQRVELAAGTPDREFVEEFPTLVCAIENAFRREQLVMELLGHPALQERIEDDALMLSALHRVVPAVEHGNIALGRQVVTALRDLLDLHRLTADLALALAANNPTCPAYVPAAHEAGPDLQPQHAYAD